MNKTSLTINDHIGEMVSGLIQIQSILIIIKYKGDLKEPSKFTLHT